MSTTDLAERMKYYRETWGLTQGQLAELLCVDRRTVQRWENEGRKPRTRSLQAHPQIVTLPEDQMKRRDFFRKSLTVSLVFAVPTQIPNLLQLKELTSSAAAQSSLEEEVSIAEALTKTYWQLLPYIANRVDRRNLDYVCEHHNMLDTLLKSSPGSAFDNRLKKAISEIKQVEGTLLYSLGNKEKAKAAYQIAIQTAKEANDLLLEANGLAWLGNFRIDTGDALNASAPLEKARKIAEKAGASPRMLGWIAASEADAWANQPEAYQAHFKCENALDRAANLTDLLDVEQDLYPIPYDRPWAYGFSGTCYAHSKDKQDANRAQEMLEQALKELYASDPTATFRQAVFYKDLATAYRLDNNAEQACHVARQAMKIAVQTTAPMELQRIGSAIQEFPKDWRNSPVVKDLYEEFRVAHQKLLSV